MSLRSQFAVAAPVVAAQSVAAHDDGWTRDSEGRLLIPEKQSRFLDWLLSAPKFPPTQKAWCEENGVGTWSVTQWKKDRKFLAEWERRAQSYNISVDRTQGVLDTLHSAAIKGDVHAAREYLKYVDKLTPPKPVQKDATTELMSDDELYAEARELLGDLTSE